MKKLMESRFQNRKTSVLFCDIESYTGISMRVRPSDLEVMLRNYIQLMSVIAHRYSGRIDKIMGDGMVVLFDGSADAPAAALFAVECAVTMQAKVATLKDKWQRICPQIPFAIRIAVATGLVCTGEIILGSRRFQNTVGKKVIFAARLQERAKPGGVIICEETKQLIPETYACKKLTQLELKGFPRSYTAFELLLQEEQTVNNEVLLDQSEAASQNPHHLNHHLPECLANLMFHEFHRTRRYGHEFSCLVINVSFSSRLYNLMLEKALEKVVLQTIRDTDYLVTLSSFVFVIIAPETMKNRVATIRARLVRQLLDCSAMIQLDEEPQIMTGSFSFTGSNADTPSEMLCEVLVAAGAEQQLCETSLTC